MPERADRVTTGIEGIDALIDSLIPGDNVVWVGDYEDIFTVIEDAYLFHAVESGRPCSYVTATTSPAELRRRFGSFAPEVSIIDARPGRPSGDPLSLEQVMVKRARLSSLECTVVDSLNTLAARWGPRKASTFFRRTCSQLFNLGSLVYWRTSSSVFLGTDFTEDVRHVTQCLVEIASDHFRVAKAEGRPAHVKGRLAHFHLGDGVLHVKPEPVLGRLSRGLERARASHDLTQAGLARLAEVTPSAISQAETGHRGLSLETLVLIGQALHVTLDDLLSAEPLGYLVSRRDRVDTSDSTVVLLDDASTGIRVTLVRFSALGRPPPERAWLGSCR